MLFRWKQNRIEGLLAQSLYEPLTDSEQRELDRALEADPALRAERGALRRMVESVPADPFGPVPNLLPGLRDRLDEPARRGPALRWAYAGAAAALVAVVSIIAWQADMGEKSRTRVAVVKSDAPDTLVAQALADAEGLIAKRDVAAAFEVLSKALSRQPGDAHAGEAQWLLAQCAFDLNRYADSYTACATLFADYYPSLEGNAERRARAIALRDLLAEAKQVDFVSLQAFDVAKRDRTNLFAALEDVAATYAKYQGTDQYALGDLVALEMAKAVASEVGLDTATPQGALAAYQAARGRCASPVAAALLDLKIGDAYAAALHDPVSAKEHYRRAAENPVLAHLATKALERMD